MSRVKSRNTGLELGVFKELRAKRVYFQKHYSKVPGKPDLAIPSKNRVIFIHSSFWHGWQFPRWRDRLPKKYWSEKIENNRKRDKKNILKLKKMGWRALVVWDHQLKKNKEKMIKKIIKFLNE